MYRVSETEIDHSCSQGRQCSLLRRVNVPYSNKSMFLDPTNQCSLFQQVNVPRCVIKLSSQQGKFLCLHIEADLQSQETGVELCVTR